MQASVHLTFNISPLAEVFSAPVAGVFHGHPIKNHCLYRVNRSSCDISILSHTGRLPSAQAQMIDVRTNGSVSQSFVHTSRSYPRPVGTTHPALLASDLILASLQASSVACGFGACHTITVACSESLAFSLARPSLEPDGLTNQELLIYAREELLHDQCL